MENLSEDDQKVYGNRMMEGYTKLDFLGKQI
jgi:hypothetical protein